MNQLREMDNQELIRELEIRIRNKRIREQEVAQLLEIRRKQRLAEYEEAANNSDEQKEIKDWEMVEVENWDD